MSIVNPTCPSGCAFTLPIVDFDECSPHLSFGEIEHIYVGAGDTPAFGDWTQLAQWTARIDNDDAVDTTKLRKLDVLGDLPAATKDTITISLGRTIVTPATWTINVEIDDISPDTWEFMRGTGCNYQVRAWFETTDKMLGGNDGILGNLNLFPTIERGQKSLHKLTGTFTWEASYAPERIDSPFAS